MKLCPFYHILKTAVLGIIPTDQSHFLTERVVDGSGGEFGIGNEPAVSDLPVTMPVVEDIFPEVIEPRLDIEYHLEVALDAKLVVELGLDHYKLLIIPCDYIYFVRHAATQDGLTGKTL